MRLLHLTVLLILAFVSRIHARELVVNDSASFFAALAEYGESGQNTVIVLEPTSEDGIVALDPRATSAGVPQSETSFISGQLIITGGPSQNTIFDSAGLGNITGKPFSGTSQLVLANATWINLCAARTEANGFIYYNSISSGLFALDPGVDSTVSRLNFNLVAYGYEVDINRLVMLGVTQASPFATVRSLGSARRADYSNALIRIKDISMTAVEGLNFSLPWIRANNVTYKSVTDPDDVLLQRLRSQGRLLPLRNCNGSLMPPGLVGQPDHVTSPMWRANTSGTLYRALQAASAVSADNKRLQRNVYTPTVMLLADVDIATTAPLSKSNWDNVIEVADTLLLMGPSIAVPRYPVLDFKGHSGLLRLLPGARMFLQQLTLLNFAPAPAEDSTSSTSNSSSPSASPMPGFTFLELSAGPATSANTSLTSNSTLSYDLTPLQLYNVKLVVPVSDYLALLDIAVSGMTPCLSLKDCMDDSMLALRSSYEGSGLSIGSITVLDQNTTYKTGFNASSVATTAWAGTWVTFTPQQPLTEAGIAACIEQLHAFSESNITSSGDGRIPSWAVVLCIVLPVALVLGLLAVLAFFLWRIVRRTGGGLPITTTTPGRNTEKKGSEPASGSRMEVVLGNCQKPSTVTSELTSSGMFTMYPNVSAASMSPLMSNVSTISAGVAEEASALPPHQEIALPVGERLCRTAAWCMQQYTSSLENAAPSANASNNKMVVLDETGTSPAEVTCHAANGADGASDANVNHKDAGLRVVGSSVAVLRDFERIGIGPCDGTPDVTVTSVKDKHTGDVPGSFTPPTQLHLVRRIGHGGQGSVFLGLWKGSLQVAVKVMLFEWLAPVSKEKSSDGADGHHDGNTNTGCREGPANHRAVQEAAIAASVVHRNVVCTYSYTFVKCKDRADNDGGGLKVEETFGATADAHAQRPEIFKLILIQELCACDLRSVIMNGVLNGPSPGTSSQESALCILLDIARGLQYLAHKNIIHGDVKDANILLKMDGTCPFGIVAKITDMGFSRHLGVDDTHLSGHRGGTPFWVAPEVVQHGRLSFAADMYAFGILIWECFTGEMPYVHAPGGGLQRNANFPGYRHVPTRMPPIPVLDLQMRCLSLNPQSRPTADQAVDVLQIALHYVMAKPCFL